MKVTLTGKMATYKFKAHYPSYLVANYLKSFVYLVKTLCPSSTFVKQTRPYRPTSKSITLKL